MKTRIVFLSDTHSNWVKVPDGDILVFAGDMTCSKNTTSNLREFRGFQIFLRGLTHKHKIIVAGNHDSFIYNFEKSARDELKDYIYLQDEATEVLGIKFYGLPWTPEFCNWSFMLPAWGEKLKEKYEKIPEDTDILITHGPPFGILDINNYGTHCGCELLLERVEKTKPKIHCFGHIHNGHGVKQGRDTLFMNASICDDWNNKVYEPIVIDW